MKGKFAYLLVGLLGSVGLATAFALPASASPALVHAPASVKPAITTPTCNASWAGGCFTPVVAQASNGSEDLNPPSDFALTYLGADPITGVPYGDLSVDFNNDLANGTQDFTAAVVGAVPFHGKGEYNFTAFDDANYHGDPLIEVEYTPGGLTTGLCATVSSKYRSNGLVLGYCVSAAQQVYIVTQRAPLLSPLSGSPIDQYVYVLEASHSSVDAQQHNALLDPHPEADNALAAVGTPVNAGPGVASVNEWSAIG